MHEPVYTHILNEYIAKGTLDPKSSSSTIHPILLNAVVRGAVLLVLVARGSMIEATGIRSSRYWKTRSDTSYE